MHNSASTSKLRVGFFGLGTMGIGMVRRLLGASFPVTVYNRNIEKALALAGEGATVARSPREAAASFADGATNVLISMVADDAASRAIWLGETGALAGVRHAGRGEWVGIECSTLTVPWVRELSAEAHKCGLAFLDAPVTGTKPHAANGELTFLVGGDAGVLEKVRPALAVMSKEIVHLGPVGSGAALKLINNFLCGVQGAALAEAYALIQREKLDPDKALPLLLNGAPGSPVMKLLATRHGKKDYTPNFQLRLMAKDLRYAVEEAARNHVKLETGRVALDRFSQAAAAGLGDEDIAALIKYVQNTPEA
jgi:3-hydroxyisobutyrate dehydrogenase